MGFNDAQSQAIVHKDGPMMVLAGPGSGKTLVITKRIEYLITKHNVRPEEILVITFTKASAKEMKERFFRVVKGKSLPVTFGTFHGIYYGILKWAYSMNATNICSEEEKYRILKDIIMHMDMEIEDEKEFMQGIAGEISNIKNNQIEIEQYCSLNCSEELFREIYHIYETRKNALKKVDFDDMLVFCYQLFKKRPDILKKWQAKFKYILIDEFQDINQVQYDVIRMLASPEDNLFIVGDDDQSIYKFRGARPEIMLGFKHDYKQTKEVLLGINYRSTQSIVKGALRIINHNTKRYKKAVETTNEDGINIHIQELKNPIEESQYVMKEVEALIKNGMQTSEIAILFRTNTEPRTLAETLLEYNIPFQMKDHIPNIYQHFIGQNMRTYMRMALGSRKRSDFLDVMNRPKRYIGRDSVEQGEIDFENLRKFYCDKEWMQDRIDQFELDLRVIKGITPYAAIQYIRKKIGYDEFLKEYANFRRMNLDDLKEIIEELQIRAKEFKTIEDWFAHIEVYTKELEKQSKQQFNEHAITLLTMHGAKGLEYESVFIISANEDITPYKKAILPEDVEEERRMFYVAMTRAKKKLHISYTKERNGKDMRPSRFVEELLK